MSNNTDTVARDVSMKPRRAAKSASQHIETRMDVHERDQAPYNDRTVTLTCKISTSEP